MEQGISFESQAAKPQVRFLRRDWLALLAVVVCAAGYAFLHPGIFSNAAWQLPGIGLALSCWLLLLAGMAYIGWKELKWSPLSCFLLASTLLLSGTYGIFSHNVLRLMNLPVLFILFILTLYSLKGAIPALHFPWLRTAALQALQNIVRNLPLPLQAMLNQLRSSSNRRFKELLLGIGFCIPVIGVVILLFSDADTIFSTMIGSLFNSLQPSALVHFVLNLVKMLVLALLIFALIYGLNFALPERKTSGSHYRLPKLTIATLLGAMSLVYAIFVYIQCRYLFAGSEAAVMEGGYAVYARSGFFQLVFVAFITLLIVLPALYTLPGSRSVRFLGGFVSLMTLVIVYSAFWRMRLYILEYGLTFLRVITLWGILVITAAMIATLLKAIHPKMRIFRLLFVFTICTWLAFNYANVYARIADYNVSAYRNGKIEALDIYYLGRLGVDAIPHLDILIEEKALSAESMGTAIAIKDSILSEKPVPYDWSLSWLKVR